MSKNSTSGLKFARQARVRRPRGSLTREAVVEAALAVVDAEGVAALSMPRLARQLDAGVMTLYRYVQSKQELLDAVAMRAIADVRIEAAESRDALGTLAGWGRGMRRVLLAHPGVAEVMARRAVVGPGIFRGVEALLARLQPDGFEGEPALRAVYTVLIYTLGFTIWEVARVHAQPAVVYAAQWREGFARLEPGQFPHVEAVLSELGTLASETQFEFGLRALVRGLRESVGPAGEPPS
ncbi:MAG TPA: TetR/AcrR family transcriptional regulator C-terminal domain-containing protein [Dehalococcoidia bacterium]|nr:TetR/AcrR family transcriptional regulator C-terminal domain-containing protein [Dehalococcoidia bacterium]